MSQSAKFTTGSTLRHVVVMTLTGSLGLSFMLLVDFLALFWISQLGREELIAAVGFAATIQFFLISISIVAVERCSGVCTELTTKAATVASTVVVRVNHHRLRTISTYWRSSMRMHCLVVELGSMVDYR